MCPYCGGQIFDLGILETPEREPGVWLNHCETCGQYFTHHDRKRLKDTQHKLADPADPDSAEVKR